MKQVEENRYEIDYGYIEYFEKAKANTPALEHKILMDNLIKTHEAMRDYYSRSLKQINHLIQIDEIPNLELEEPRWEIYKISLSFRAQRKIHYFLSNYSLH